MSNDGYATMWFDPESLRNILKFQKQRENWLFIWMQLPLQEKERINQLRIQRSLLNYENRFIWAEIRYGNTLKRVWTGPLSNKVYKADGYAKTLIEIKEGTYSFVKFLTLNDI